MVIGQLEEEFYAKLVDFIVFGLLGVLEYFFVVTVVSISATLLGIPLSGGFTLVSAAIIVGATILTGGMPTED